ncbi:hypothetical protein [Streptomyces atratus]|uniref:hypothetical protein n=1 Tax=Streptomyces atratus TaxID=1893 RepID=UPI00378D1861
MDEATKYLADHFEQIAFSYSRSRRLSELAVRYSGNARMVRISDRSKDRKLNALKDTTQHCHALFFDSPLYLPQRARSGQELEQLLGELETLEPPNGG